MSEAGLAVRLNGADHTRSLVAIPSAGEAERPTDEHRHRSRGHHGDAPLSEGAADRVGGAASEALPLMGVHELMNLESHVH